MIVDLDPTTEEEDSDVELIVAKPTPAAARPSTRQKSTFARQDSFVAFDANEDLPVPAPTASLVPANVLNLPKRRQIIEISDSDESDAEPVSVPKASSSRATVEAARNASASSRTSSRRGARPSRAPSACPSDSDEDADVRRVVPAISKAKDQADVLRILAEQRATPPTGAKSAGKHKQLRTTSAHRPTDRSGSIYKAPKHPLPNNKRPSHSIYKSAFCARRKKLQGRVQARLFLHNVKLLCSTLTRINGSILSLDTEGIGPSLNEVGWVWHKCSPPTETGIKNFKVYEYDRGKKHTEFMAGEGEVAEPAPRRSRRHLQSGPSALVDDLRAVSATPARSRPLHFLHPAPGSRPRRRAGSAGALEVRLHNVELGGCPRCEASRQPDRGHCAGHATIVSARLKLPLCMTSVRFQCHRSASQVASLANACASMNIQALKCHNAGSFLQFCCPPGLTRNRS
jgi:hypothetical protein